MKLRKVLAAFAASAVAVSAMAVSAFAASVPEGCDASSGMFACLLSDDSNVPLFTDHALVATVTKISVTIECRDRAFEQSITGGTDWYGGGFGVNSNSTGWDSHEWSIQDGVKELTMVPTDTRYQYKVTWDKGSPIFSESDTYAQAWIQDWTSSAAFSLVSFELLNADGVDIRTLAADEPATPDEPTAEPDEPTAEPAEPTEEPAEPTEEPAEPTEEPAEPTEEPAEPTEEPAEPTVEPAGETAEPAAPSTPAQTDSKGSPDTGVAGVAAAAGVAALAGVAVVVARKRK